MLPAMNRMLSTLSILAGCAVALAAVAADAPPSATARALAVSANNATLAWGPCPAPFTPGCQLTVLQGDPGKPNADIFLRIPAGYTIPPHSHTSAEHMVLVSGELEVRYSGQDSVTLKAGDFAYGPPGLPHLGRCRGSDACTLFITFEQPVDALLHEGPL